MKVLSIKQPQASLIAYGIKKYEFRTWNTKYKGEILIHASKSVEKKLWKSLNVIIQIILCKVNLIDSVKVDDDFREVLKSEDSLVYNHVITDKMWQEIEVRSKFKQIQLKL